LVAGISDEHAGVASSMFNAGQQVGGAVGLAVIGSVAWTVVNNHVRSAAAKAAAAHQAAGHGAVSLGRIYGHALSTGVGTALTIGAATTVVALLVAHVTIRVRRADLPANSMPAA